MSVTKKTGGTVGIWTLSDPSDIIGQTVGGNRYGWMVSNDLPLALDNITRSGVTPAPTCDDGPDERWARSQLRSSIQVSITQALCR